MERTILQAVMVCLGFVSDIFNLKRVRAKGGVMKGKDLIVVTVALLTILGVGWNGEIYAETPTIDSISINHGESSETKTITVTIEGQNFTSETEVKLEDSSNSEVAVDFTERNITGDPQTLGCIFPAHAVGFVDIIVYNPVVGESATAENAFAYTIPSSERVALKAIYENLINGNWSPTNKDWKAAPTETDDGFSQYGTECYWEGVDCDNYNVTTINLAGKNLTGSVPNISDFKKLTSLDLSQNKISSVADAKLGNLPALTTLNLSENSLTSFPVITSGQFGSLETLNLSNNKLTSLPSGVQYLSALTTLDLSGNSLSIDAPAALNTSDIKPNEMKLKWTRPTTIVPDYVKKYALYYSESADKSGLKQFDPDDPSTPTIEEIGDVNEQLVSGLKQGTIYYFWLKTFVFFKDTKIAESNYSKGIASATSGIPESERSALTELYNATNGDHWSDKTNWLKNDVFNDPDTECTWYGVFLCDKNIPQTVKCNDSFQSLEYLFFIEHITKLNFENNNLKSTALPLSLQNIKELKELNLSKNSTLSGNIPVWNFQELKKLYLNNNSLTGSIPSFTLPKLEELYLNRNRLQGAIPTSLKTLSYLQLINLSGNALTGSISSDLSNLISKLLYDKSDFRWNMLDFTKTEQTMRNIVNDAQIGNDYWENYQTVAPTVDVIPVASETSILLKWNPIGDITSHGGYEISYSSDASGYYTPIDPDFNSSTPTTTKDKTEFRVDNLECNKIYYFRIHAVTYPHEMNDNRLESNDAETSQKTLICNPPTISSKDKYSGPATGNNRLKINGTNFKGATVKFNNFTINRDETFFISADYTAVEFTVPPAEKVFGISYKSITEPKKVNVTVINDNGGEIVENEYYIYNPRPIIIAITGKPALQPSWGYKTGGSKVVVRGNYFKFNNDLVPQVQFGTYPATNCKKISENEIECNTPTISDPTDKCKITTHNIGYVDVKVTNPEPDGQTSDACQSCFEYRDTESPKIIVDGITPSRGTTSGEIPIKIIGENFLECATVKFGTVAPRAATPVRDLATSQQWLECKNPPYNKEEKIDVVVTNPDGKSVTCKQCFEYKNCEINLEPQMGSASGGRKVIITPDDIDIKFENIDKVFFGTQEAEIIPEETSATQITCKTRKYITDRSVWVDVKVSKKDGTYYLCESGYKFTMIPSEERQALIDLYLATDGNHWDEDFKTSWCKKPGGCNTYDDFEEGTECNWKGLWPNEGDDYIIEINLNTVGLKGKLPSSIKNLSKLAKISLAHNNLEGPIPNEITQLVNLQDGQSDFRFNKFCCTENFCKTSSTERDFLRNKQAGGIFENTQECYMPPDYEIIKVDPISLEVTEPGKSEANKSAFFQIWLNSKPPTSDVTIALSSSNIAECEIAENSVTFSKESWNTKKTVTVTAKDDKIIDDGRQPCTVITSPASSNPDSIYNQINPSDVTVSVIDDDEGLTVISHYPTTGTVGANLPLLIIRGTKFGNSTEVYYKKKGEPEKNFQKIPNISVDSERKISISGFPAPSEVCDYDLKLKNPDKEFSIVGAISFMISEEFLDQKKAVIISAGDPKEPLWTASQKCAEKGARTLYFQGYRLENIHYLSAKENDGIDIDIDGNEDVAGLATKNNLKKAITEWAKEPYAPDELILYISAHGKQDGSFIIMGPSDSGEAVTAKELNEWLTTLQNAVSGIRIIVIYDACYGESFISSLKANNRILIASAKENAWFDWDGDNSFSYWFWDRVYFRGKLYEAFDVAKTAMAKDQTASIIAYEGIDLQNIIVGRGRNDAASPIKIGQAKVDYSCGNSGTIWANNITSEIVEVDNVKAKIYSPEPDSDGELRQLKWNETNQRWEIAYQFDRKGIYTISLWAQDTRRCSSEQRQLSVDSKDCVSTTTTTTVATTSTTSTTVTTSTTTTTTPTTLPGDVDGDADLTLKDAVRAIEIVSGKSVSGINKINAVNGKNQIGLADCIYILRKLSKK